MKYTVRHFEKDDIPEIMKLIQELADFENASDQVRNSIEQMQKESHLFECFIAEDKNNKVVGIALFYICYFTWVGKSLYLDDLIVKEEHRGNGIGTLLLNRVLSFAKEENCKRIRWQVLDWNKEAITLYEKLGATVDKGWYNCDIEQ
jgi:diamine N-acetyltransferase